MTTEKKKIYVIANWKMNKGLDAGILLARGILEDMLKKQYLPSLQIVLLPAFIHLNAISNVLANHEVPISLGAQNCYEHPEGAFTGEIAISMLASIAGLAYVLVGHSERRLLAGETDECIAKKINGLLSYHLKPIFCCGESQAVRQSGQAEQFVTQQLESSLFHLATNQIQQVLIAYEPIWAIGTGVMPQKEIIFDMQEVIRRNLAKKYGPNVAKKATILYGGSCNKNNIGWIMSIKGIDGTLVGNASLQLNDFLDMLTNYLH